MINMFGFHKKDQHLRDEPELSGFNFGVWRLWPSYSIQALRAKAAGFNVSENELAWISSLLYLGFLLTPLFCSYLVVKLGRKTILCLTSFVHVASWLVVIQATSPYHLCAANFFGGLAVGVSMTTVPVYVSEISSVKIRGALIGAFLVFINLGQVFLVNIGMHIDYDQLNYVGLTCATITLLLQTYILKESPFYLLAMKKDEEAKDAYKYFHRKRARSSRNLELKCTLDEEVVELKEAVEKDMQRKSSYLELLSSKRAFTILVVASFIQNFGGANSMLAFGAISLPVTELFLTPHQTTLVCVICGTLLNFVSSSIVDSIGRKPLLVSSLGLCSLFTGLLMAYYFMVEHLEMDLQQYEFVPHVLMIFFISSYTSGFAISRSLMIGELFPTNTRTHAGLLSTFCFASAGFIINLSFLPVMRFVGVYCMFLVFFTFNLIGFITMLLIFVETKGKTLFEIQEYLKSLKF